MFEQESDKKWRDKGLWYNINADESSYKTGFKEGAEFGYEKANEWYYPSKGECPKEDKRYLCKIKAFVGGGITYECLNYDSGYSSWKDASGDVIAWKEVTPPKE